MTTTPNNAGSAPGIDLAALEQLARAATPGEWKVERLTGGGHHNVGIRVRGPLVSGYAAALNTRWPGEGQQAEQEANAEYIAAANPQTVLALIALARATPQHSVTEQASIDGDALYRAWHKVGADVAGLNFADFAAALDRPLASTAASEQHTLLDELENVVAGWGGDLVEKIEAIIKKHRAHPDCGACPGNGSTCATECRLRADSPAAASEQQASVSEIERIADELDQEAQAYEGDFADVVRGCVEALRALSGRATIPSEADERPLTVNGVLVEQADIGPACRYLNENTILDGTTLQEAWNKLVAFYVANRGRAALTHRATTATPGYKLVPELPTLEMQQAALSAARACKLEDDQPRPLPAGYELWSATFVYRAMLAATPDIATTAADQQGASVIGGQRWSKEPAMVAGWLAQQGAAQAQAGEVAVCGCGHDMSVCVATSCDKGITLVRAAMAAPATRSKA